MKSPNASSSSPTTRVEVASGLGAGILARSQSRKKEERKNRGRNWGHATTAGRGERAWERRAREAIRPARRFAITGAISTQKQKRAQLGVRLAALGSRNPLSLPGVGPSISEVVIISQ